MLSAGRTEPIPEEYERRILEMKDMFEKGERYELDWWSDESGDADPRKIPTMQKMSQEAGMYYCREELEHEKYQTIQKNGSRRLCCR